MSSWLFSTARFKFYDSCCSGCEGRSLIVGEATTSITSKNFPLPHYGNGKCLWLFTYPNQDSYQTTFYFTNFVTSNMDKLFIFNGIGKEKVFFGEKLTVNNILIYRSKMIFNSTTIVFFFIGTYVFAISQLIGFKNSTQFDVFLCFWLVFSLSYQ